MGNQCFIQDGMDRAAAEGFAAANDPRELRQRNQDRHALTLIAQDAAVQMLASLIDPTVGHPLGFSQVALAAAALIGAIDVYTLHLDTDVERRWQRLDEIMRKPSWRGQPEEDAIKRASSMGSQSEDDEIVRKPDRP